jgi:hypothetical protein
VEALFCGKLLQLFVVFAVGKFHAKKKVSKKSQVDLRGVLVEILTDVCKLDEAGEAGKWWGKLEQ